MTEQLLIAILYSQDLIQNIKSRAAPSTWSSPALGVMMTSSAAPAAAFPILPILMLSPIVFDVLKFLTQI